MKAPAQISKHKWDHFLSLITSNYNIYAPQKRWDTIDYELLSENNINDVIYNVPKPTTPLKTFFLPVKENVVTERNTQKRIIIGAPACDLTGLSLVDEMYLKGPFTDPAYKKLRDSTTIIGTDCFSTLEHCHCTIYGVKPYPGQNADMILSSLNGQVLLHPLTEKGENLLQELSRAESLDALSSDLTAQLLSKRTAIEEELNKKNNSLPDYKTTGKIVKEAENSVWEKYSATCVSCGACATSCPTCTCFLLIDRPDFEKIRNLDACQYPGFERVAAGEDPLKSKPKRFRNRYMCKYVWKPAKYNSFACTGCGRCIESCIGKINKNELFEELIQEPVTVS
jgi:sulfhydrogenase subunit beta (sulfur reductase)